MIAARRVGGSVGYGRQSAASEEFLAQWARTRGFSVGAPTQLQVSCCGRRVAFLRSEPADARARLWVIDIDDGNETRVEFPEPADEAADTIRSYLANAALSHAACTLGSDLAIADLTTGIGGRRFARARSPSWTAPDPTGHVVAYGADGAVRIVERRETDRLLAGEEDPAVSWGRAELIAREELGRSRGAWWSPDGRRIAATRVDVTCVTRFKVGGLAGADHRSRGLAYPVAGSANADVSLWVLGLDGERTPIVWDRGALPYLVDVRWWPRESPLTIVAQSRDQHRVVWMKADPDTGTTTEIDAETTYPWVSICPGSLGWLTDGSLVRSTERDGTRRIVVNGTAVTPPQIDVRSIVDVGREEIVFIANRRSDPGDVRAWRWSAGAGVAALTDTPGALVAAAAGGGTVVIQTHSTSSDRLITRVLRRDETICMIASHAERPLLRPRVSFQRVGLSKLESAVVLPSNADRYEGPLPILVNSHAGPTVQQVLRSQRRYLVSQWLADQGFAVLVVDGRGTPGRGTAWEHAVHGDLARGVLTDQVEALLTIAGQDPRMDLSRVGIRGWSFGGYLAALAVLRRPDIFHAAVAGAPVTDWRLYDTHYTERYLGLPNEQPEQYDACSLIADARQLRRPLMLIHGLDDQNVMAVHSQRLSSVLTEADREHVCVALPGVGHAPSTSSESARILRMEVAFLQRALDVPHQSR